MEIIPFMLITVTILLSSFPVPIKAPARSGGGGRSSAGGGRFVGGGGSFGGGIGIGTGGGSFGFDTNGGGSTGGSSGSASSGSFGGITPGESRDRERQNRNNFGFGEGGTNGRESNRLDHGMTGGSEHMKDSGPGDPGAAIVVIPKRPKDAPKPKPIPMPKECKEEVRTCINTHIYGSVGAPEYHGPCCTKLKNAVPCVCKFLKDPVVSNRANDLLRGCHFRKPKCRAMPMPQVCSHEVQHCVDVHIYGDAGKPQYHGACCEKFKNSKKCVCKFLDSQDSHLSTQANGVLRGCHFNHPNCPKT